MPPFNRHSPPHHSSLDDEWWKAKRQHNLHTRRGTAADDSCGICNGSQKTYEVINMGKGKNRNKYHQDEAGLGPIPTEADADWPGNPEEPPKKPSKHYNRRPAVTEEEAIAALGLLAAVDHKVYADMAFEKLSDYCLNRRADVNVLFGHNWDGSTTHEEVPKCPQWTICHRTQYHWGKCRLYDSAVKELRIKRLKDKGIEPPTESYVGFPQVTERADGYREIRKDSATTQIHPPACNCPGACAPFRNSQEAGKHAWAGVHPQSIAAEVEKANGAALEKELEDVVKNPVGNFSAFYEFTGKQGCTHAWTAMLKDNVFCPECHARPAGFTVLRIEDPNNHSGVAAYRAAKAKAEGAV